MKKTTLLSIILAAGLVSGCAKREVYELPGKPARIGTKPPIIEKLRKEHSGIMEIREGEYKGFGVFAIKYSNFTEMEIGSGERIEAWDTNNDGKFDHKKMIGPDYRDIDKLYNWKDINAAYKAIKLRRIMKIQN